MTTRESVKSLKMQIRQFKQEYKTMPSWFSKDLKLAGKKRDLLELVAKYNKRAKCVPRLQALFRGAIVRRWLTNKNYKSCINDTDFYTMDPLCEIPWEEYYCHVDSSGRRFGFSIASLLTLFGKKNGLSVENPYNREEIPLKSLVRFWRINTLMCPSMKKQRVLMNRIKEMEFVIKRVSRRPPPPPVRREQPQPTSIDVDPQEYQIRVAEIIETLNLVDALPLSTRIEELFIQFDYLGNYTQSSWFNNLQPHQVRQLYLRILEAWNRVNTRQRTLTCMIQDPFRNLFLPTQIFDVDAARLTCVRLMESLTYTGFKPIDQQFGVNLILCSLTFVSQDAWVSMRHLYD